tara:strand:+ start:1455 stop:2051 length:597 start_codon:yes stop_codon:yes gene_type:complete
MSFRKEKKIKLTLSDQKAVKKNLLSNGMKILYPARQVNSCYFDTKDLRFFHDSDEGILPRKKVRIRHYNYDNIYTKETKITSEEGRFKKTKPFEKDISKLNYSLTLNDLSVGIIYPSLIVSYYREYFLFEKLRITFDSLIRYKNLLSHIPWTERDPECVIEIKTSIEIDDDFIFNVINMPFSRFSKYCRGLQMTQGII